MSTIFRNYKTRLHLPTKEKCFIMKNQLENIFIILDELLQENSLLITHLNRLEQRCEQWIKNERSFLINRLEKLENENHIHQTYQIQTETSLRSITNLILQILLAQQELRKEYSEQRNVTDSNQWTRTRQQVNEYSTHTFEPSVSIPRTQRSLSSNQLNNDRSIWNHQVKEHDTNHHSSTLATEKSKNDKLTTARSNKLYYAITSNEKPPTKPIRSTVDETKKKPSIQTRVNNTNHEKRPIPVVRNINTTRTPTKPPPPPPPPTVRVTSTTVSKKNVPSFSTINKSSPRPSYPLGKTSNKSVRSVGATPPRPRTTQPTISPSKPIKTLIPIPLPQSRRVTDLDKALVEKQKSTLVSPPQPPLFSKNNVKVVRPVRSQELKLFTCHLTPEMAPKTNESLSTLTPSSRESISKQKNDLKREFSEDSLDEYSHSPKLVEQTSVTSGIIPISSNSTSDGYFHPIDNQFSLKKTQSSIVHRLVFPERLGRLLFHRRILSDTDIYRKNCSKDQEILHHVYHLDTIRDYSMDFYMLTTYASDSQLRAWLDDEDDDEILRYCNANNDEEHSSKKRISNNENFNQDNELDWYSELELLNSTNVKHDETSSFSSDIHMDEFSPHSSEMSTSGASNRMHSTPVPSILREILNHSWTNNDDDDHNHLSTSNPIEQIENDLTSSIVSDEFQSDFYYLCPITKTTSFSMNDYKT